MSDTEHKLIMLVGLAIHAAASNALHIRDCQHLARAAIAALREAGAMK